MTRAEQWIGLSAQGIEAMAVVLILAFIAVGTVRWLQQSRQGARVAYEAFRVAIARAMLLGLELLVAADIIRTVILEPTLERLGALGALVVLRTLLSWTLTLEVEGRWPWQDRSQSRRAEP